MRALIRIYLKGLLFGLPFLAIILSYVLIDPFEVIFVKSPIQVSYKNAVTDYRRTEGLLNTYEQENYGAFTFGNSQIQAFSDVYPDYVDGASYHDLHNPGESVWNIYKKIELIDSLGLSMDHVLISLNAPLLENVRNTSPMYVGTKYLHHPVTQGTSWVDFHMKAFGFYLSDFYFIKYLDFNIFHVHRPNMEGVIPNKPPIYLREAKEESSDTLTTSERTAFYADKVEVVDATVLDEGDLILLAAIQKHLVKHDSHTLILFPPNAQIEKMNPKVITAIREIFGAENVFDFTGKNPFIQDEKDFVDNVHFKPVVAKRILDQIQATGKVL